MLRHVIVLLTMFAVAPAAAQDKVPIDELLSGVVRIKTFINPDARTLENLGREREGSGVVLDSDGLVLTIGYLMVEATPRKSSPRMAGPCRPISSATITRAASASSRRRRR